MTAVSSFPYERRSPLQWLRVNLFSTWYNSLLTVVGLYLIYVLGSGLLGWVFVDAQWRVIEANFRLLIVGQYPPAQFWRLWIGLSFFAFLIGASLAIWGRSVWLRVVLFLAPPALGIFPFSWSARAHLLGLSLIGLLAWLLGRRDSQQVRRLVLVGWVTAFPIFILLVAGLSDEAGVVPLVPSNFWGGLLLTFLLTVVGILFSFPLGVFLALGRQSRLPMVRWFSIVYIEFVRGVPLVTILFMSQLMLPLFLPAGFSIDRVLRAMAGIVLFSAAYLAENVRGGLQAIPRGQYEAAYALGLNGFQTMAFVILPQALRLVIPILVGQFIALFKDTSLVAVVGLLDLLGIAKTVLAQPAFIGLQREVYVFISLIYWVFSYIMSFVSQKLEEYVGLGKR